MKDKELSQSMAKEVLKGVQYNIFTSRDFIIAQIVVYIVIILFVILILVKG